MGENVSINLLQEKTKETTEIVNQRIEELGQVTDPLYNALKDIQSVFDEIRKIPSNEERKLIQLKKVRLSWEDQVKKIESDYKAAEMKAGGFGIAGAGAGLTVIALGPSIAMGVATTFGVASTGTAISTLTGAAASNAALAWLGGGALAAGGSGMAGGQILLGLAGPIGWTIAGLTLLGTGFSLYSAYDDKKRLERIFSLISIRDNNSYKLALLELNERIQHIQRETKVLRDGIEIIKKFGTDYEVMTEEQQYQLISYVNLMNSSTQLLVNPILGLQPPFSEEELNHYYQKKEEEIPETKIKDIVLSLCNLLFKIRVEEDDRKILWKALRNNDDFLKEIGLTEKEFDFSIIEQAFGALDLRNEEERLRKEESGEVWLDF